MQENKISFKTSNVNMPVQSLPKSPYMGLATLKIVNPGNDMVDAYVSAKKKRGLFSRIFGAIIPSKVSDRNIKKKIEAYQFDATTKEDVKEHIQRYEQANRNTSEIAIDSISTAAAMGVGFFAKKTGKIVNIFAPKYKAKTQLLTAGLALATGILSKLALKGLDLIGMNKEGRKEQRLSATTLTGGLDGATGYLAVLNPLLMPAGIAINTLARYMNTKRNDKKDVSLKDFCQNQKDTIGISVLGLTGISLLAAKGHINISSITDAIKNAKVNKNHTINYTPPEGQLTEFQQLARDIGYDLSIVINNGKFNPNAIFKLDEDFMKILLEKGENGQIDSKIKKLELENIFLPKYLQTVVDIPDNIQSQLSKQIDELLESYNSRKNRTWATQRNWSGNYENYLIDETIERLERKGMDVNGFKDLQGILKKIKSKCSTSRTLNEAQEMINKEFGNKYTITKPCGVGSVAETYFATDNNSGETVVVKIVKDYFLREDKISIDKCKILRKIRNRARATIEQTIRTPERKMYDISQAENMFKVWGGEINLANEAKAATAVGEQSTNFNAVGVIEAKQNIFIMQKAKGIPLDSDDFVNKWQKENLSEDDFKNFVETYVKAYCEQLFSIPKTGKKVVQSDPHCGNILVDVKSIKGLPNNSVPISIIDYGNTTQTNQAEAIKNLFNHLDYLIGNTDSIAEAMLEGAKKGKNKLSSSEKNKLAKELSKALKEAIYNPDTKLAMDNPVKVFSTVNSFCLDFIQKNNIIPNASHINQMKAEETYIISNLGCLKNIAESCGYDLSKCVDRDVIIKQLVSEMNKAIEDSMKYNSKLTTKEISKRYKHMVNNTEEALSCLGTNFGII